MINHKQKIEKTAFKNIWISTFLLIVVGCYPINCHFIQIDQHEFRSSAYPNPVVPQLFPPTDMFPQPLPSKELTPVELMVDLTNDLTYRILHYHSVLNRNNFAYSPSALMSTLVALYEGAAGRSAVELKNVLQFPNNKDILRVGYRDIHRRLRTYFFGSENPLKGLSLNKDNVTISQEYETILMFYGYDLSMDMVLSTAQTTSTTVPPVATIDNKEKPSTINNMTTPSPDLQKPTVDSVAEEGATTSSEISTTEITETSTIQTTEKITTTTTTTLSSTTEELSTTATETETETETEESPITTTTEEESEVVNSNGNDEAELISPGTEEQFLRIQKPSATRLPSGRLMAPPNNRPNGSIRSKTEARVQTQKHFQSKTPTSIKRSEPLSSFSIPESVPNKEYLPDNSRSSQYKRKLQQGRQKRHLGTLGSFNEADPNIFVTLFRSPPPLINPFTPSEPGSRQSLTHISNEFEVEIEPQLITDRNVNDFGPTEQKQNYNTDIISHIFYLGGRDIIYTTYKVYNAVLYYKYFEHLKMSVLELELDTPEYNLMIFLPDYHVDLVAAAASLRLGPTLRLLRKQLKPRWVQAIIPDFRLHGTMFLTNDLQNLGICDIFEPNRADFHPMTAEKGIYVKHIEQSINVSIRTHPINQLRRSYGSSQLHPIQISVNHPFLFFVIDRDLDVVVMAGRILNPLNVRIQ